jgi:hypothetical protein
VVQQVKDMMVVNQHVWVVDKEVLVEVLVVRVQLVAVVV